MTANVDIVAFCNSEYVVANCSVDVCHVQQL